MSLNTDDSLWFWTDDARVRGELTAPWCSELINQRHDLVDESIRSGRRWSCTEMQMFIQTCDASYGPSLDAIWNANPLSERMVDFAYHHLNPALLTRLVPHAGRTRPSVKHHPRAFCVLMSIFEPTDDEIVELVFYDHKMLERVRELYPKRFLTATDSLSSRISEHIGPNWLFLSDERRGELTQALMATEALPDAEMSSLVHNLTRGSVNKAVARYGLSERAYTLGRLFANLTWTDGPILQSGGDYQSLARAEYKALKRAKRDYAHCLEARASLAELEYFAKYSLSASQLRIKEHAAAQQVERLSKRVAHAEQWLADFHQLFA